MIGNKGFGDVFIQDTHQPLFQFYVQIEQKTDITLTSAVSVDDSVISVSSGHGFTVGNDVLMTIVEGDKIEQASVIGVSGDDITIAIPSAFSFTTNAKVIRGNKNLNGDGSVSEIESCFKFYDINNSKIPIDISKVKITMSHANAGDSGKFGGISALSGGGFYFRRVNASRVNLGNYINNQDFQDKGAIVLYTDKGPGGINATEITFNMKDIFGQVLRLSPNHDDEICAVNRNDLSSLTNFYISLIGSYTECEQ